MREKIMDAIALALIPDDVPPTTMELHGEDLWKTYLDDAETCLSAIETMDCVIVPRVATPEMIAAAWKITALCSKLRSREGSRRMIGRAALAVGFLLLSGDVSIASRHEIEQRISPLFRAGFHSMKNPLPTTLRYTHFVWIENIEILHVAVNNKPLQSALGKHKVRMGKLVGEHYKVGVWTNYSPTVARCRLDFLIRRGPIFVECGNRVGQINQSEKSYNCCSDSRRVSRVYPKCFTSKCCAEGADNWDDCGSTEGHPRATTVESINSGIGGSLGFMQSRANQFNTPIGYGNSNQPKGERHKKHEFGPGGGLPLGLKITSIMGLSGFGFYNIFRAINRNFDAFNPSSHAALGAQVAIGILFNLLALALLVSVMESF